MSHNWIFEIKHPYTNLLRELASIPDNEDICIIEQSDDFGFWLEFSSPHLNDLSDPNEVYNRAFKLKMLLDGVLYIIHENKKSYTQIVLGTLYNGKEKVPLFDRTIKNSLFDFSYFTEDKNGDHKLTPISLLIHIAAKDDFIRNLLQISSSGMDYNSLYKAVDEIKYFLKGKESLEALGFNAVELDRFNHTANNFETLGIDARHGNKSQKPPKKPMSLNEAQKLISNIIIAVLKKYYFIDLPRIKEIKISPEDLF
ncbi:hypothetical protein [Ferruginibacter sp. HRS2-29]|uniref:hypothetical protein n=1 Tax=Ferruginibacter sp. HRS2-29 TaxID=2487334 RepID=UPI0020CCEAA3|nr:hypothetical protein [Ferruginibacter sp. HRS2-29]MCP9750149.1 hypothetical protein [Ferruginibacter sp. HRS2-29]